MMVLLVEKAYSDSADLILSSGKYTNEESGPDFSVFSVFQAKGRFERKISYLQLLITHD